LLTACSCRTRPLATAHYTPSLHDALPISAGVEGSTMGSRIDATCQAADDGESSETEVVTEAFGCPEAIDSGSASPDDGYRGRVEDRKSTRLNSSHVKISYAVFCLKKKNNK